MAALTSFVDVMVVDMLLLTVVKQSLIKVIDVVNKVMDMLMMVIRISC